MASRTATKTGVWSDPTVWDGGVALPTFGDSANSNGFTVTIDQDIDVGSLIGTSSGAGGFSVTAAPRAIAASIVATVRTVLTCSHNTGTLTVTGNVNGGGSGVSGISMTGTGVLDVVGNVLGGTGSSGYGINSNTTGTVNVTGNVTGGTGGSGFINTSTGTINVTGNALAGTTTGNGILNNSTGTIVVTGNASGRDGGSGAGVSNALGGVATVGKAVGNNYGPGGGAAYGTGIAGGSTISTSRNYAYALEYGPFGMAPVTGHVRMIADVNNAVQVPDSVTLAPIILAETVTDLFPTADDVREGVVYMGMARTGLLVVPDPANVAVGVATDDTVGTAVLSAAAAAAAILDALTADHDTAGSIGEAIGSGGGGGGGASAAEIRTELAVELGRIDVAVSTRATQTSVDDLPTNAELATSQAAADDVMLAAVSALPTTGDIRTELATELGRIDVAVSSVAAGDAPTVIEISAAVWDALRADHADVDTFGAVDEWASAGGGGGGGATAEELWSYAQRTLTMTAAQVQEAMIGSDLHVVGAVTFTATLTGLTFPAGWSRIFFTAKNSPGAPDATATVQIVVSNPADAEDGLLFIDGQPVTTLADQGSLVVAGDALTITIGDNATTLLRAGSLTWDVKALIESDSTSVLLATGNVRIDYTETEEID